MSKDSNRRGPWEVVAPVVADLAKAVTPVLATALNKIKKGKR